MERLNNKNGLIYILFNQQIAICLKNIGGSKNTSILEDENEEVKQAKLKLKILLQEISRQKYKNNKNDKNNEIIDDNYIDNIIDDYNSKIFIIKKIYQTLLSFEERITNEIQKIDNESFINETDILKLFEYIQREIIPNIKDNNLKENLNKEINNTLNLIKSKKIDISQINRSYFDPEIISLLNDKGSNNTIDINNNNDNNDNNDNNIDDISKKKEINKLNSFFEKNYLYISKGKKIRKINYKNTGIKEYLYKLDYEDDLFKYYTGNDSYKKPKKVYEVDKILKIVVGIKTNNIKNKINKLNIKKKK